MFAIAWVVSALTSEGMMVNRMKYYIMLCLLCMTLMTGCDSDSESSHLFPGSPINATKTLYVPEQYATIQAAINKAGPGDFVRVAAGVYRENLTMTSKRFGLRGAGKGQTIIHGVLMIDESIEVSIEGISVLDGGIHARKSSIKLTGNEILNSPGPGLWIETCTLVIISDNIIHNNGREGILFDASQGSIGNNSIMFNAMDGLVVNNASPGLVVNQISRNGRDGVSIRGFSYNASPDMIQNVIQENGGVSNYDIVCFGGNANPTGVGNIFNRCANCGECRSFGEPVTYLDGY